ncbi:hypothetical protein BN7_4477 [Wickerhamomyces ciferrii]|uniref:Uncharacterized protein n=1 Tax=Wickerhamomyces ciferrii (strain ATCC 14091 / BCRC 22168 / CBS 111 / JCM 3599 / NBRC 0793 / NRRL Y-1031 F-60-10) TaxID=1206466 RepID=K0KUQ7_WICCF|nr:uncharacterized protein BN7_4477 [Wickerhamomyces ciferrii]CCH44908.1 hypothetical protein BN7_4477 [Wickerhamomyces ciferrii]
MARVTRSKSKTTEIQDIPTVKKEEQEEEEKIPITRPKRKTTKLPKEPIRKRFKPSPSHQLIQQFTRQKLESLKPTYKPPPRKFIPSKEQQRLDKICPTNKITNITNLVTSNLKDQPDLTEQVEMIQKFTIFKNMNIDIRTIEILKNSKLGDFDEYDLKLKGLKGGNDENEQFLKFREIFNERKEVHRDDE